MDTLAEREISFYAEDGNIDIFVSIERSVCDGVTVSRQYCSRDLVALSGLILMLNTVILRVVSLPLHSAFYGLMAKIIYLPTE